MKDFAPLLPEWAVRAMLMGVKTQARVRVARSNSDVGVGNVDWSKFSWRGVVRCNMLLGGRYPEASVWVDGLKSACQYLHVPWDFEEEGTIFRVYPRVEPGTVMRVREAWVPTSCPPNVVYRLDFKDKRGDLWSEVAQDPKGVRWRSPVNMPRSAVRLQPVITRVRAQRLQDMTERDAVAEGMTRSLHYGKAGIYQTALEAFRAKWDEAGEGSWDGSLWVWVYEWDALRWPTRKGS